MHRVCVFCGSSPGRRPEYVAAARQLGQEIARRDLGLVFGGGHVGLMGVVADAALAGGAEVIGVIPQALQELEVGHTKLTQLHVVPNMHTRKAKMAELSDAFLVLPGGLGTLEETFEVWTWAQLGFHAKPLCLLDVAGFWQPLVAMVDRMVEEQFVGHDARQILHVGNDPATLLDLMARADSPRIAPVLREQDL